MLDSSEPYIIDYFGFGKAENGASVRWVANGHRTHATGLLPLNRCRHLGSPWESKKVEQVILRMLAACSRVVQVVAQPHSLYVGLRGIKRQLRYTPDIEVMAHSSLRDELASGRPLFEIVAEPFPRTIAQDEVVPIVLELKSDRDEKVNDPVERTRMGIFSKVYEHVGLDFFTLMQGRHIDSNFTALLTDLEAGAHDRVGNVEKSLCNLAFGSARTLSFGHLSAALGGQPRGERMVKALHMKGFISIDLRRGLNHEAPVWLMQRR